MTNGEKLKETFPNIEVVAIVPDEIVVTKKLDGDGEYTRNSFRYEWWTAEYKEPNTKNNSSADCITKSDAIAIIQDMHGLARADVISDAVDKIIATPSATPQPRKGHWIPHTNKGMIECSECHAEERTAHLLHSNFCPKCGADMESNITRKSKLKAGKPIEGNNDSYNCENWIP